MVRGPSGRRATGTMPEAMLGACNGRCTLEFLSNNGNNNDDNYNKDDNNSR